MLTYPTIENKKTIQSNFLNDRVLDLSNITFIIPQEYEYDLLKIAEKYIARPDLISYDAYGDDMFADIICKLNGISNPFELNEGMVLIIPSPESILDFIYLPTSKDLDENWGSGFKPSQTQTSKTKNSKRQANEAILGDARFKIDKTSKVIIY